MPKCQNPSASDSDKMREIEASISEGKLMLDVLRSLPKSENNDAFISRFEELVSRLEKYRTQGRQSEDSGDVQTQLHALKEKQEKIRMILEQTAQEFQNSFSDAVNRASSSQTSATPETPSATDLLAQFKSLVSSASLPAMADGDNPTPTTNSHQESLSKSEDTESSTPRNSEQVDKSVPGSSPESDTLASLKWSSQFSTQFAKSNDLIEDTRRFQNMVDRLMEITRRAHLTEETGFLIDISKRFGELRKSFDSLRESYESVRSEPQMSDEVRGAQLAGLQEFLTNLDRNLESTKECFFTIYHLVKSSIEQGVTDGSLREAMSDTEEGAHEESTDHADSQPRIQTPEKIDPASVPRPDATGLNPDTMLEAQKAYLAVLQGKTASEHQEIARLLRQRDELAERLNKLKAVALAASKTGNMAEENESTQATTLASGAKATHPIAAESPRASSPDSDLEPIMMAHLEAKKRELAQLKAQLELFRKAEQRMAALELVAASGQSPPSQSEAVNIETGSDTAKLSAVMKPGSRSRHGRSHRPSPPPMSVVNVLKTRFRDSLTNGHDRSTTGASGSETSTANKLDTQPEASCINDNTERLYENMREARILLEEQRGNVSVGVSVAGPNMASVISGTAKAILSGGAASVATSQDRTTLATWGGSSPTESSSASASSDGPVEDDEGMAVIRSRPQPASNPTVPAPQLIINLENDLRILDENSKASQTPERRSSRHIGDKRQHQSKKTAYLQAESQLLDPISLPQLGHSPSPPGSTTAQASDSGYPKQADGLNQLNGLQLSTSQNNTSMEGKTPEKIAVPVGGTGSACNTEVYYSAMDQRVQRLETNMNYLYYACHNLFLENAQLHSAVTQLLLHRFSLPAHLPNLLGSAVLSNNPSASVAGNLLLQPSAPQSTVAESVTSNAQLHRFSGPSMGAAELRRNQSSLEQEQSQLVLHRLMQQQAQKYGEMDQLLRQLVPGNRILPQQPSGSNRSSQLISPVSESRGNMTASILAQSGYPFDAQATFSLNQPMAPVTSPHLAYRTGALPSTSLIPTSPSPWSNEFYAAGFRPTSMAACGLYVPPAPTLALDPYTNIVSPQSSLFSSNSLAAPLVNASSGHMDMMNQVWLSPGSTVSGRGSGVIR